jgi:hypothetical protein
MVAMAVTPKFWGNALPNSAFTIVFGRTVLRVAWQVFEVRSLARLSINVHRQGLIAFLASENQLDVICVVEQLLELIRQRDVNDRVFH